MGGTVRNLKRHILYLAAGEFAALCIFGLLFHSLRVGIASASFAAFFYLMFLLFQGSIWCPQPLQSRSILQAAGMPLGRCGLFVWHHRVHQLFLVQAELWQIGLQHQIAAENKTAKIKH